MRDPGIEVNAVTLVDDVHVAAMPEAHLALQDIEDFLSLVLKQLLLFRPWRQRNNKRFHGLAGVMVGDSLVGIPKCIAVSGHEGSFIFSHETEGGACPYFLPQNG